MGFGWNKNKSHKDKRTAAESRQRKYPQRDRHSKRMGHFHLENISISHERILVSALVLKGRSKERKSLDKCLQEKQPIVSQICFGSLRNYFLYSKLIERLVKKPINKKHSDLFNLLIAGLYSLDNLKRPVHACVNESVEARGFLGKTWAKNLINAVLRNYLRKKDFLIKSVAQAVFGGRNKSPTMACLCP